MKASLSSLENYLLSSEVYWPVSQAPPFGKPGYPRLTLGALLLARKRLQALSLSNIQEGQFAQITSQMDQLRSSWRVAWGQKATKEYRARLNLWRVFLEEFRQDPERNDDRYPYEVGRRVMLALLAQEADGIPESEINLLNSLDRLLSEIFIPGDFIWDRGLIPSFPREIYWYLYGSLKWDESQGE
jgi:hypothetical protein